MPFIYARAHPAELHKSVAARPGTGLLPSQSLGPARPRTGSPASGSRGLRPCYRSYGSSTAPCASYGVKPQGLRQCLVPLPKDYALPPADGAFLWGPGPHRPALAPYPAYHLGPSCPRPCSPTFAGLFFGPGSGVLQPAHTAGDAPCLSYTGSWCRRTAAAWLLFVAQVVT